MVITNEKKAINIALENVVEYHTIDDNGTEHLTHCYKECKKSALDMAKWKDKQFKEKKKKWIDKTAKWFEDNLKDWFEEEMMSNIIIEFKKQAMKEK